MNFCKLLVLLVLPVIYIPATAQLFAPKKYPQGYFGWPVAATKALAANFGELRPNHYHMGFDCKTDQRQNVQVLAAADGYIAKVKIEPSGFGRAIYINHPNGLTTLYAHLNDFYPELEKYIKAKQYQLKSWKVFLDIPAGLFTVYKGDFIAFSGNTGGSQGPHLHFEIRDTKSDKVLNPSLFGFPITDNVPPTILRLAMYNRNISTYEQTARMITIKKIKGEYVTSPALVISNTDKVSFAISAFDTYTGSYNKNGIYEAIIYDNDQPVSGFQIDSISYDETRDVNAHIDHKLRAGGGPFLEHLSRLPGYLNSIYKSDGSNGVITLDDDAVHAIKIVVKDADGNASTLSFSLQRGAVPAANSGTAKQKDFLPGYVNVFENSNISFYLPENALYDSIRFRYSETAAASGYPVYQLQNTGVPVHGYFPVTIRAANAIPQKMVMHRFGNGRNDYVKAVADKGWYRGSFRYFGSFQLIADTIGPVISAVGFKEGMNCAKLNRLAFVITDNTEEIAEFTATLDGQWLRFTNDKGRTFIYQFDEMCLPGEHELKIRATDLVGNITEKVYHFTR